MGVMHFPEKWAVWRVKYHLFFVVVVVVVFFCVCDPCLTSKYFASGPKSFN